jgi:hypothetical protein
VSDFFFQTHHPLATSQVTIGGLEVEALSSGLVDQRLAGTWLRRVGADPSRYDPSGELVTTGVVTTGQVPMSGLREVFGVGVDAKWRKTGEDATSGCTIQVSLDGGDTFLAWTGAAWETQGDDEVYNELPELNDHLHQLELRNPRQLGFRVRLTAADDDTPVLAGVVAYLEWAYDPRVDLRELMHSVLTAARFPFSVQKRLTAAVTRVAVPTLLTPGLDLPIQVFNVTDDALCNTDLFDEVDGDEVVLTAQQAAGKWLELRLSGSAPVIVAHQDEMWTKTQVPSVSAFIGKPRVLGQDVGLAYGHKRGEVLRKVRARQTSHLREYPVRVEVTFAEPESADRALEAVRSALSAEELRSPGTGLLITLIEDSPGESVPSFAEGVDVARWTGRVQVQVPVATYNEYAATRRVLLGVHP